MRTDLANRTGQENYTVDINSDPLSSPVEDFTNQTIANNPLYVVNYSPNKTDKNVNITRQKINASNRDIQNVRDNLSKSKNTETENVYQEPRDSLQEESWYNVVPSPRPFNK